MRRPNPAARPLHFVPAPLLRRGRWSRTYIATWVPSVPPVAGSPLRSDFASGIPYVHRDNVLREDVAVHRDVVLREGAFRSAAASLRRTRLYIALRFGESR